ncbi:MAG: integrase/recombinase XerD [Spirosomataceae bacterium]|jgi:site-specific recombinase XerD
MIHLIDRFTDKLKKGKYNNVTIKAYRDAVFMFYNRFRDVPLNQLDESKVSDYLNYLKVEKALSQDSIIQNAKAIKLYFKIILEKPLDISVTGKKKQEPPYILSKEEISKIIDHAKNYKHKLIVQLAYGLGLKLNELISLQVTDIDFEKQLLTVRGNDNSDNRVLNLGGNLKNRLHYFIEQKAVPSDFVFSNAKGLSITPRGVQIYFSKIITELNLDSSITMQNLRHSYAIHLLNKGIDLHHLQKSLGHKYLQTTALYQSLVDFSIEKLETPIDDLF